MTDREKFEAWFRSDNCPTAVLSEMEKYWSCWQAAVASRELARLLLGTLGVLRRALAELERLEAKIDLEWGTGRDIKQIELDGHLPGIIWELRDEIEKINVFF